MAALVLALILEIACTQSPPPTPDTGPKSLTGSIGAAAYDIEVPAGWNGTLFLYSHGYVPAGAGNPARSSAPRPVRSASATPTNGQLPLNVTFSSAGTNDPNGRPITFDWDFGDGSAHSAAANPTHNYTVAGSYTARLTVTNNMPAANNWSTPIVAGSQPPGW